MQQQTLKMFSKIKNESTAMQVEEPPVKKQSLLPWVEKYRPAQISELTHQEEVVNSLSGVLKTGNLPHLLLYGPPGTGKTSAIVALAKQLFGPNFWKSRVLELNASDDRGITVIRTKVKKFAEQMSSKNPNPQFICPGYKIIVLDEADSMTQEAQGALRRIIEDFSTTTRFCIICNYITKIIEPLASRCVKYRFKAIPMDQQIERLRMISTQEEITIEINEKGKREFDRNVLNQSICYNQPLCKLVEISGGDLRKSINMLQSASTLYNKTINVKTVFEISGFISDDFIDELLIVIKVENMKNVKYLKEQIIHEGYNIEQLIIQLCDKLIQDPEINEIKKAKVLELAALAEKSLIEGGAEDLIVLNLLTQAQRIAAN